MSELVEEWREKIVLCGNADEPLNWFMSSSEDNGEFDYE